MPTKNQTGRKSCDPFFLFATTACVSDDGRFDVIHAEAPMSLSYRELYTPQDDPFMKRCLQPCDPFVHAICSRSMWVTVSCALLTCLLVSGCSKTKSAKPSDTPASTSPPTDKSGTSNSQATAIATNREATSGAPLLTAPGVDESKFIGPLSDAYARIDPTRDGWESEAFGATAGQQLNRFGELLRAEATAESLVEIEKVISTGFAAARIFSADGDEVFSTPSIQVKRSDTLATSELHGIKRFQQLQNEFRARFSPIDACKMKFKVVRVANAGTDDHQTVVYFHANGPSAAGLSEITATWNVQWDHQGSETRIKNILVSGHENVTRLDSSETTFADCTASVLGKNDSYRDQILRGTDYWRSRLPRTFGLDVVANHGIAVGDVNGDHLDDIYLCQQGGLPNRLFIQLPDGTLVDQTSEGGADWLDYCASALFIDLDNDGDRDLVVAEESLILLMENDGQGHFALKSEVNALAQTFSITASDFDLDGDLDIFCCGYNPLADRVRTGAMGEPMPYHDAQNGGQNMLLRNEGNWSFSNVADAVGLGQNNNRFSFAASWEDYDNDGDSDLYVANDYGRNNLYRNDGGKFHDVAADLGVEDMSAGMSVNWADFNQDGWMDFYISNMFSAAGNRITFQRQFRSTEGERLKQQYQRHARGNSLFQSDGEGGFTDVSVAAGITMGRWAWGSRFCDLNNDSWPDILVANGFITTEDTGDL